MKSSVIHVLNHFLQQSFKKHIHIIHDHTNLNFDNIPTKSMEKLQKLQKIQSMLPMLMINSSKNASENNAEKEIVKSITDDEIVVCDINEILKKDTILYNEIGTSCSKCSRATNAQRMVR